MEARLPDDKLFKLRHLLVKHAKSRKIKLRDLQALLGLLNFCCNVVIPGRAFLRRLTDLTRKVKKPHHRITLSKESRCDLKAWQLFIEHFNGKHLLLEHRWVADTELHLFTDSAGSVGFAAIFQSHWFCDKWPEALRLNDITFEELFPVVLAFEIWGELICNRSIILHFDNMAVVHILNKQTCKEPLVMKLVRRLVLSAMKYNILFKAGHIQGKINILPDLLSRLQVARFRELTPNMDPTPTPVPRCLLDGN
ncbi:uncharacterized protein LOC128546978 [Mercenaria mercenaria]|uniref:uncharacterized protein LOC128546978 n=1 Tax=Mercenaria mercenaria TaxID=6596 RepID=UPI00234F5ABC|nr:uncharacterized protein LOC128546978 [Mercenaria mercenaria]